MNNKIKYFIDSLLNAGQKPVCPYCQSTSYHVVDRKYLVTQLLSCAQCNLYYRHPGDKKDFNLNFYQSEYKETGITTDLPAPEELKKMKEANFKNSEKGYQGKIDLIKSVIRDDRRIKIIDYGSSWGYASYQFINAGMQVQSYEISVPRAKFGNDHLALNIVQDEKLLTPENDVFFSSHVIEHHPDIRSMNALAKKMLSPDGFYIAFCPNASDAFRAKDPKAFHHLWGLIHPNYLSSEFFRNIFSGNPYYIGSNPYQYDQLKAWDGHSQFVSDLDGVEIFVVSRPNINL